MSPTSPTSAPYHDLTARARAIVDTNRYLTLGTTEPDQRPRVSPVWFTHAGYRTFYWVSSPVAQHSKNVVDRPAVAMVIFDSTAAVGRGRAVYLDAQASMVAAEELPQRCAEVFPVGGRDGIRFGPEELSGDGDLRLFRAAVTAAAIHIPGGDPVYGTGIDSRREIEL